VALGVFEEVAAGFGDVALVEVVEHLVMVDGEYLTEEFG